MDLRGVFPFAGPGWKLCSRARERKGQQLNVIIWHPKRLAPKFPPAPSGNMMTVLER